MRITIEMSEAESRSTSIHREIGGATTGQAERESPATDAGPPPEALLLALGGRAELGPQVLGVSGDADAGGPPSWLVDIMTGGAEGRQT